MIELLLQHKWFVLRKKLRWGKEHLYIRIKRLYSESVLSLHGAMIRINEHCTCKVCGMFQNKQWISGSVMRFRRHLRSEIHTRHPHKPLSILRDRTHWNLPSTPLLPTAPNSLQSDHLSPSILQKGAWHGPQLESWQELHCNAKPSTEESVLITGTSQLFFQSAVVLIKILDK